MTEGTESTTRPRGRQVKLLVVGDNAYELELAALDEAREFFGTDMRLKVVDDYVAFPIDPADSVAKVRESGKRFYATVTVQTIESLNAV